MTITDERLLSVLDNEIERTHAADLVLLSKTFAKELRQRLQLKSSERAVAVRDRIRSQSARDANLSIYSCIISAYKLQRDEISDSDLDDDQPLTLTVNFRLRDVRNAFAAAPASPQPPAGDG